MITWQFIAKERSYHFELALIDADVGTTGRY
jgi:hypothetical protein